MSSRSRSAQRHTENWNTQAAVPWTRGVVDLCLVGTFLVAPFCMGGREPVGQFVLTLLAAVAAVGWAIHQLRTPQPAWRLTGAEVFMLLGMGIVVFQVVPISQELLAKISPRLPEIIPLLWGAGDPVLGLKPWQTVSLAPDITISHFSTLIACAALFFILVQRVATWKDVQHLVNLLIVGAVAMAAFGIVQFATSNGQYFWFYHHVQASTKYAAVGGFANANHFADFLAMTVPLQIWLLVRIQGTAASGQQRYGQQQDWNRREVGGLRVPALLALTGLAVTGLAILLSMSRGGIVLTCGGTVITLLLFWRKSLLNSQLTAVIGLAAVAGMIGTVLFGDLAAKMIEQNVLELTSADVHQLDPHSARQRVWQANIAGIREFPILGTGLGSHPYVYKLWYDYPDIGKVCSHAESGYLQVGLETGLAGLAIVILLYLLAGSWCLRIYFWSSTPEVSGLGAAVLVALLVNLAHSVTDFVWYAPACVMVVLALGVVAARCCALPRESEPLPETPPRPLWSPVRLAWATTLPCMALLAAATLQLKWTESVAFSRTYSHRMLTESLIASQTAKDSTPEESLRLHKLQIRAALDSIAANPNAHEEQMRAGLAYAKLFVLSQQEREDAMPLIHLQDAARASNFSHEELLAWLDKPGVLGEDRKLLEAAIQHFRESLQRCPTQGRSYVELAAIVWVEGADREAEQALLKQALKVRPYDSTVLFANAYRVAETEGLEGALPYLQKAFDNGPEIRLALMQAYAKVAPAAFFLDHFQLDRSSLAQLEEAYREAPDRYGYGKVVERLAKENVVYAVDTGGLASEQAWLTAHRCYVTLQQPQKAYHCGMAALEVNPSSYNAHQTLGLWLYKERKYALAAEHLIWCNRRRPGVDWIRKMAENALTQSHLVSPDESLPPPGGLIQQVGNNSSAIR